MTAVSSAHMHNTKAKPRFIVLMGVSGSGKTSVGRKLAGRLGWDFYEGDEYHPPENVARMAAGQPLEDRDRAPWLARLRALVWKALAQDRPGVLAASLLKRAYRQQVLGGLEGVQLVFLCGDYELIHKRMQQRADHYMGAGMLASQFADLEEPPEALVVEVSAEVEQIVDEIVTRLGLQAA